MERAESNNDAELLLDQTAWVKGLARSLAIDASGADDVAQEAMLAALQSSNDSGGDVTRLRIWLTGVVRNLSNLRVRRESRRRVREEWVARPEPTPSVAETVSRAAQLRLVVDEVMELDEPHRSTILLRYFDGLSTQRVAEAMECTPEAVRKRLSRALRKLRERLDLKHGGDGSSWLTALAPFLGDLALGPGGLPLGLGAQGAGKLGGAGWTAVGGMAAGTALLIGGSLLGSEGASPSILEPISAHGPGAALDSPTMPTMLAPDRERRSLSGAVAALPSGGAQVESVDAPPLESDTPIEDLATALSARPLPVLSGQVFDLAAQPVAGLDVFVIDRTIQPFATSTQDGRFEGTLYAQEARLVARSAEYATLRAARVNDLALHSEPIIVVGTSVDLQGHVMAEDGRALQHAQLSLVVAETALHGFPFRLQSTVQVERHFETSATGGFELDDWVSGAGLYLRVDCPGYEGLSMAMPDASTRDLTILLPQSPLQVLHGAVSHRDGAPASSARIALGPFATRADSQGLFRLEYRAVAPETALCASSPGFVPGQIPSFGARIGSREELPLPVHLVLGGPLRSIAGVIHDHEGRPAADWDAFAIAAGSAGSRVADGGHGGESTSGGKVMGHAHTSADGRFLLNGLAEGDYIVHAVHAKTLVLLQSDVVRTDDLQEVDLRIPEKSFNSVQGRIVGRDGEPLTGARVTVVLNPAQLGFELASLEGASVRTDTQGGFLLAQVPLNFVDLRIDHPEVSGALFRLPSGSDTSALEFKVARDRFIQLIGGDQAASTFEVFTAQGQSIGSVDENGHSSRRTRLREGRSSVVQVTEDARDVVVYDENGGIERVVELPDFQGRTDRVRAGPAEPTTWINPAQ